MHYQTAKPLAVTGVTETGLKIFNDIFGSDSYNSVLADGSGDYIYLADNLINLKGKKYHKKRNHLSKINGYDWKFYPMTEAFFDECIEFSAVNYNSKNGYDDKSSIAEQYAIHTYFTYFNELELKGGVITVEGKVRAFTIGERLNSNTFLRSYRKGGRLRRGALPCDQS